MIKVALSFTPFGLRWAVRLLDEAFRERSAKMTGDALNAEATMAVPEDLKNIIQGIFDALNSYLTGRPFILAAVKAIQAFILNNLLDAIWDSLFNKGERLSAGAVPMHYQPKNAEALAEELDAAVALG